MFYTTELLLSKYLKASQACGTPPVTSKSNNSDKVTAQWFSYNNEYYLWVINGGKRILQITSLDGQVTVINNTSLLFFKDITDITIHKPELTITSDNSLSINYDKELDVIYPEHIIKFEDIINKHKEYYTNNEVYLFKIPVPINVLKVFNIENIEGDIVHITHEKSGISRKFCYSSFKDGYIYTYCADYVIEGLDKLIPRLQTYIDKMSGVVRNQYQSPTYDNNLKSLLEDIRNKLKA